MFLYFLQKRGWLDQRRDYLLRNFRPYRERPKDYSYYSEFLDRFPTLSDVARAEPAAVMEAWEGLGYYARARNLHALAKQITEAGGTAEIK